MPDMIKLANSGNELQASCNIDERLRQQRVKNNMADGIAAEQEGFACGPGRGRARRVEVAGRRRLTVAGAGGLLDRYQRVSTHLSGVRAASVSR